MYRLLDDSGVIGRQQRAKNEKRPIIRGGNGGNGGNDGDSDSDGSGSGGDFFLHRTVQSTAVAAPLASLRFFVAGSCCATQRARCTAFLF